jgi:methylmalonyl-CoA/ethylmalonyl-CoA epimerase
MKVEHIGIAVKNMKNARELYTKLLNTEAYKEEVVDSERVNTVFFKAGESKIELLEGLDESSAISKYIEKKGEGIHHVAFEVEDIYAEIKRLEKEGFHVLNLEPKKGADNKLVAFIHPKSCNGVLVELCQEIKSVL